MNRFKAFFIILLIFIPLSVQSYDISSWLDQDSIVYEQPEPNTWIIPYNSSQGGTISVGVLSVDEKWIMIMVPLFELPDEYPSQAFMQLAQANYQMNQMKLGLSEENYIFLQMELPYHLVNKQELINNIEFIAYAVDENLETIAAWFGLTME